MVPSSSLILKYITGTVLSTNSTALIRKFTLDADVDNTLRETVCSPVSFNPDTSIELSFVYVQSFFFLCLYNLKVPTGSLPPSTKTPTVISLPLSAMASRLNLPTIFPSKFNVLSIVISLFKISLSFPETRTPFPFSFSVRVTSELLVFS